MTTLLTAAQMRAIETAAISRGEVTGQALMARAGQGVVDAIDAQWPTLAPVAVPNEYLGQDDAHRAVVLCGPGNNGGDGFVVARLLAERGWTVDVFFYGVVEKLPPDARANYERWCDLGPVTHLGFPSADAPQMDAFCHAASHRKDLMIEPDRDPARAFVVIDALFGIGLSRPISGLDQVCAHWDYLSTFRDLNQARLVAIDIPSGLSSDTGRMIWSADPAANPFPVLCADLTVTFHREKVGHVAADGPAVCGRVVVADIGL